MSKKEVGVFFSTKQDNQSLSLLEEFQFQTLNLSDIDPNEFSKFENIIIFDDQGDSELLKNLMENFPNANVILLLKHQNLETILKLKKRYFFHHSFWPCSLYFIRESILNERSVNSLDQIEKQFPYLAGQSELIKQTRQKALTFANAFQPILIQGPSGSGKTHLARFIHLNSFRKHREWFHLNLSFYKEMGRETHLWTTLNSIFEPLIKVKDIEIHESFYGILYIEGFSNVDPIMQASLFDWLYQKQSISMSKGIKVVLSLNEWPTPAIQKLSFFNEALKIQMFSLDKRKQDLQSLIKIFTFKSNVKYGKNVLGFSHSALDWFQNYHWPGGVQELEVFMNLLVQSIAEDQTMIDIKDFPLNLSQIYGLSAPEANSLKELQEYLKKQFLEYLISLKLMNVQDLSKLFQLS